ERRQRRFHVRKLPTPFAVDRHFHFADTSIPGESYASDYCFASDGVIWLVDARHRLVFRAIIPSAALPVSFEVEVDRLDASYPLNVLHSINAGHQQPHWKTVL